jgi:hypothetical protein
MLKCQRQTPDPEGFRKLKVLIARNSYPKLKTTVKKTMENWIPEATGFELTGQAPISGRLRRPLGDGTTMDLEFLLMAFDDPTKIEDDLRSFEFSILWVNEAKENHPFILKYGQQRLGRYPPKQAHPDDSPDNPLPPLFNGCDEPTILMDTNMFDDDHWLHKFFYEDQLNNPDIQVFEQPGALIEAESEEDGARYFDHLQMYLKENPLAENIKWLPGGYDYYWNILETSPETVWTDVMNRVGSIKSGKPVFSKSYNDRLHYKNEHYTPHRDYPIIICIDWGKTNAAYVFCQYIDSTMHVFDCVTTKDEGTKAQFTNYIIPKLNTEYIGFRYYGIADPAGRAGEMWEGEPLYLKVQRAFGIEVKLAPVSNRPSERINAISSLLTRIDGMFIYKKAAVIRKAMQGGYQYVKKNKVDAVGHVTYHEEPEKNVYSHPMDGLGYGAIVCTSSLNFDNTDEEDFNTGALVVL